MKLLLILTLFISTTTYAQVKIGKPVVTNEKYDTIKTHIWVSECSQCDSCWIIPVYDVIYSYTTYQMVLSPLIPIYDKHHRITGIKDDGKLVRVPMHRRIHITYLDLNKRRIYDLYIGIGRSPRNYRVYIM